MTRRGPCERYKLSKEMGRLLLIHEVDGPDACVSGEDRTLRERCTHDYEWIVEPTLNNLRQVFHDPGKDDETRLREIVDMKRKLLDCAHVKKQP